MSGLSQESPHQSPAGVDLSGSQYFFVTRDAAGVLQIAGLNSVPSGVLQDAPGSGETGTYETARGQRLTVIAGEAIVAGEDVGSDAAGKARDADTTNDVILGKCIRGGATDEEIIIQYDGFSGLVP